MGKGGTVAGGGGGRLKGTAGYGGAHLTQIATLASFMNGKI